MTVRLLLLDHRDPARAAQAIRAASVMGTIAMAPPWAQQADQTLADHGGFTLHDRIGDAPTSGYMVSLDKSTEEVHPASSITAEVIDAYRTKHASALAHPDVYLGAWVHEGKAYLDIPAHFTDLDKAMRAAADNDQIAVFDIGTGTEIITSDYYASRAASTRIFATRSQSSTEVATRIVDLSTALSRRARYLASRQEPK